MNYPKIQCNNCRDIIQSSYSGEWVACSCFLATSQVVDNLFISIYGSGKGMSDSDIHLAKCGLTEQYGKGVYIDSTDYYTRIGGRGYTDIPKEG